MSLIATLLLVGGYFASQFAFFSQATATYIKALDASQVPLLSLVILLAAVGLLFLPENQGSRA